MKDSFLAIVLGIIGLLVLLLCLSQNPLVEALFQVAFGWVLFLCRELPGRAVNWADTVTAAVCLAGLAIGLHLFLRWLYREVAKPVIDAGDPISRWHLRWTGQVLALILLAFLAGISAVGM